LERPALVVLPLVAWAAFGFISGYLNSRILQELRSASKLRLYRTTLAKNRAFFVTTSVGSLESLIDLASFAVRHLFFESAVALSKAAGTILAATVAVFLIAPPFIPAFVVWTVAFLCLSVWLARRSARCVAAAVHSSSVVSSHLIDTLNNIELVKTANAEWQELELLRQKLTAEERTYDEAQRDIENATALLRWLIVLVIFGVAAFAHSIIFQSGPAIFTGVPLLFMLLLASVQIEAFGRSATGLLEYFGRLATSLNTLQFDLESRDELPQPTNRRRPPARGEVDISGLSFAYGSDGNTLVDVSLHIRAGEKVGIVGPSGAGKSTLVRLIRGHLTPTNGTVLIDGVDTRAMTARELGRTMAFISQETMILHRSLAENVCYGLTPEERANEARLLGAVKAAGLDGVAERVGGLHASVGERGLALSGGERQRIALARALLSPASIVILDEATSAIDVESERVVHQVLFDHFIDKTIIIIAHRPSSFRAVDRMIFLESGRIVENGLKTMLTSQSGRLYSVAGRMSPE
jgi:ABC-type multidrug transport system fused ATPase/permease subunit